MEIEWKKKATKQLRKIGTQKTRANIFDKTEELSSWPDVKNVKPLKNQKYPFRLRVGDYRVFFEAKTTIEILFIEEVKIRDERTY